jgi:hypothetical protein
MYQETTKKSLWLLLSSNKNKMKNILQFPFHIGDKNHTHFAPCDKDNLLPDPKRWNHEMMTVEII